ncbi:MAG: M20 family metallo-hydrolase [Planctomycetota bacterium]|jgi:succinyl-diaminopimelate desuccinylase
MDSVHFDQVAKRIHSQERAMVDFQRSITAIQALSPRNEGRGEWAKTSWIADYLAEAGVENLEWINAPDEEAEQGCRPNLIVRIPGQQEVGRLWIMAHTDVVPAGDLSQWDQSPWEVVEREGKLIGRGVEDNQKGLTSGVFALLAFLQEGVIPIRPMGLVLCADEETGSAYGLDYVLEQRPDLFTPEDLIIVPDAGNPDSGLIEVAEKSILWLRFSVRGKQVHASMPQDGVNAGRAGADLICRLEQLYTRFSTRNDLFLPPISTFEPTQHLPNVPNVNTVPGEDVFLMDSRVLPEVPLEEVKAAVREICDAVEADRGVTVTVEVEHELEAAPPTAADAPVVSALQTGISRVYGVEATPQGIGGGTVAASFRNRDLPAAVWCTQEHTAHQPNEYCFIEHMVKDAQVFAHLALQP